MGIVTRREFMKKSLLGAGVVLAVVGTPSGFPSASAEEKKTEEKKKERKAGPQRLTGVFSPVITPFQSNDLRPDAKRFARHCRWLLAHGCSGLAIFGTNSEANSMSVKEKEGLLSGLVEAGVKPASLMPGTGSCNIPDAVQLTTSAVRIGASGVLMLPPFYYKGVPDDGIFRYYAEVIERTADPSLRIYLYHIPQVSGVPITLNLIDKLLKAYPGIVAGIKDSGGDWTFTKQVLDTFKGAGFDVFSGSEQFLLATMRNGGAGCISATANVNPGAIDRLFREWQAPNADDLQAQLNAVRMTVQKYPMIPALKRIVAHYAKDEDWRYVRPPYVELNEQLSASLIAELDALGFKMPDIQTTR
jgi:4-hydroxy-tetrahydrodipicolinate synthase